MGTRLPRIMVMALTLCLTWQVWAQEVSYQGELRQSGVPFDGTAAMKFVIIDDDTGLTIWSSDGSVAAGDPPVEPAGAVDVSVSDGLFSVMLGIEPSMVPISGVDALHLGSSSLRIWVSTGGAFERLSDQMLASSPSSLSVRQVDPDATGRLAMWDGARLSSAAGVFYDRDREALRVNATETEAQLTLWSTPGSPKGAIVMRRPGSGINGYLVSLSSNGESGLTFVDLDDLDAGARLFLAQNRNVGIRTERPEHELDVAGQIRAQTGFVFPDGTVQTTAQLVGPAGPAGPIGPRGPAGTAATTAVCNDLFFPCTTMPVPQATVNAACAAICPEGVVSATSSFPGDCTAVLDVTGQSCTGQTGGAGGVCPFGQQAPALCCICKVQG